MNSRKVITIFVLSALSVSIVESYNKLFNQNSEQSLLNFITNSREFANSNPKNTQKCFEIYRPKIEKILKDFENGIGFCDDTEKKSTGKN